MTRWGSFLAGCWVGILGVAALEGAPALRETHQYRTLTGRLPFTGVTVDLVEPRGAALAVAGMMVKRR